MSPIKVVMKIRMFDIFIVIISMERSTYDKTDAPLRLATLADEPFFSSLGREKRMVQGSLPEVPAENLPHARRGVVSHVRQVMERPPYSGVIRVPETVCLEMVMLLPAKLAPFLMIFHELTLSQALLLGDRRLSTAPCTAIERPQLGSSR